MTRPSIRTARPWASSSWPTAASQEEQTRIGSGMGLRASVRGEPPGPASEVPIDDERREACQSVAGRAGRHGQGGRGGRGLLPGGGQGVAERARGDHRVAHLGHGRGRAHPGQHPFARRARRAQRDSMRRNGRVSRPRSMSVRVLPTFCGSPVRSRQSSAIWKAMPQARP